MPAEDGVMAMGINARDRHPPLGASMPDVIPETPIVMAQFEEIDIDPYNVRETLRNIPALMESISRYGLLENLVGVEIPEEIRRASGRFIELRAGSRRIEAIRRLRDEGRWPSDRLIPVAMLDSAGYWEHLVENIQREDVEVWEVGRRLSEAASGGLNHREIALRVGRSNGWVSRHIQIGTGLAPETIAFIKKQRLEVKIGELFQISILKDRYGDPDGPAQMQALARKRKRQPARRDKDSLRAFSNRINYLRNQMPVPPLIRPAVTAVLDYLEGGGRPNFKAVANQIMGDRVRMLASDDDDDEDRFDDDDDGRQSGELS